jgi:predicted RNA binding protein YcfA (HicA-like mRNA interferase family)
MTRLPRVSGKEVVRALERAGFAVQRVRGSHVFLKHSDGRVTSVPVHSRETLGPG